MKGVGLLLLVSVASADPIDAYLTAQMRSNHIPGLAVAIVKDGRVVKARAYGVANLEWNGRTTLDTRFQLASTTKALTGTILMSLVEQGRIVLDDSVSKYLPDAPVAWRGVTVRHLASHMSGIPDGFGPNMRSDATATEEARELMKLPMLFPAGEKAGYASGDFVVLSAVLERVLGLPLQEIFRRRLFEPLGMTASGFDDAVEMGPTRRSSIVPGRAGVYLWDGGVQKNYSFLFPIQAYSAGGAFCSAGDLARWAAGLDRGSLLKAGSMGEMWSAQKLNSGEVTQWGIGWVVRPYRGERTAGHSGGPALSDVLRFVDRKVTIIVLQNQERMYPYLAQGVADLYLDLPDAALPKGVADLQPGVTAGLRAVLVGLAADKLDAGAFGAGQDELVADVRNLLGPYVRSLTPLGEFRLLSVVREANDVEYTYAARYGKKVVRWAFDLDGKGKIVGISPSTP